MVPSNGEFQRMRRLCKFTLLEIAVSTLREVSAKEKGVRGKHLLRNLPQNREPLQTSGFSLYFQALPFHVFFLNRYFRQLKPLCKVTLSRDFSYHAFLTLRLISPVNEKSRFSWMANFGISKLPANFKTSPFTLPWQTSGF